MRAEQIAVQLYPLRDLLDEDVPRTLRAIADAGYQAVELAGLPTLETGRLKAFLADAGLQAMGAHISLDAMRRDLEGEVERVAALDCPWMIVPWLPDAERTSADGVRRLAVELGRIGEACAAAGRRLAYHNHAFEFAPLDGTTIWDILFDTLPPTVDLELDVYWATVGGRDPVQLIEGAAERIRLLHMKDMAAGPDGGDVAPGDGILPWSTIVEAGTRAGVEWYVVEKDDTRNALADVTSGLHYLRGLAAREV